MDVVVWDNVHEKKCKPQHSLGEYVATHKLLRFDGFYFIVPIRSLLEIDYFKTSLGKNFKVSETIHFERYDLKNEDIEPILDLIVLQRQIKSKYSIISYMFMDSLFIIDLVNKENILMPDDINIRSFEKLDSLPLSLRKIWTKEYLEVCKVSFDYSIHRLILYVLMNPILASYT